MSVSVSALTKIYGEQKAVDSLSFDVKKGEILGFLGPNGAGKTTTMKILTCFLPPTSGKATVCGFDVMKDSLEVRKRIGYLPEHNPLYKDMYVQEFLLFVADVHKVAQPKKAVFDIIEQTGLLPEMHKPIQALSKGYRQRVGLAQALIHQPEVLILDEPTSGLDPNQLAEIRKLIKELGKEKTVIFSTHIMQEVQAVCDRAIILNKGKLVADATIADLQSRFVGENILTVEFSAIVDSATLKALHGVKKVVALSDKKFKIHSNLDIDIQPIIFKYAVDKGLSLVELHKETQSVEDVFQRLTSGQV